MEVNMSIRYRYIGTDEDGELFPSLGCGLLLPGAVVTLKDAVEHPRLERITDAAAKPEVASPVKSKGE